MNTAKISEIFLSYQGEGPYAGEQQLFIRFFGCSWACAYCDTVFDEYKIFSKESLLQEVLKYKDSYYSVSLTGGEPLDQISFLKEFTILLKRISGKPIYLETNGILYDNLREILDSIDIIAMDFKLPSSTKKDSFWSYHERFLEIAKEKEVFVKAVVTENTTRDDIIRAGSIISKIDKKIPFILQPVDPRNGVGEPSYEILDTFKKILLKKIKDVQIIPQWQKLMGVR